MKSSQIQIGQIQLRDTCMAMTLLMLILLAFTDNNWFYIGAVVFLLLGMTIPKTMKPFAILWYKIAEILGNIVSKIILGVVFVTIVVPVALLRKLMGKDSLRLKHYNDKSSASYFVDRNYTYSAKDFDKTY